VRYRLLKELILFLTNGKFCSTTTRQALQLVMPALNYRSISQISARELSPWATIGVGFATGVVITLAVAFVVGRFRGAIEKIHAAIHNRYYSTVSRRSPRI
jgi:hypothetical protein